MDRESRTSRIFLYQDLGILVFLLAVTAAALVTALTDRSLVYQHTALMLGIVLSSLLLGLRARMGAIFQK